MHPKYLSIKDFSYHLPDEKIARYPLSQRDDAKLLICKNEIIEESKYNKLADYIPQESLLVYNQTKVINARLVFHKPTGGRIEVFCLEPDDRYADITTAMNQKGDVYWKCLVGGAAKWKSGQTLSLQTDNGILLVATIIEKLASTFLIKLSWNPNTETFATILHDVGKLPLPPYLHRDAEEKDKETYQTFFAKEEGSVAAPTAALHFTPSILASLKNKNCEELFVTLHVGAGTFMPVKSDSIENHEMHAEWMEVELKFIEQVINFLLFKNDDKSLIAVGTTSCRTLESLYWIGLQLFENKHVNLEGIAVSQWMPYEYKDNVSTIEVLDALKKYMIDNKLKKIVTRTQILIAPGYKFKIIDALITNFHQPQSTLLLLIAALVGDNWKNIYDYALHHQFRFLSYGDGSLLWKK